MMKKTKNPSPITIFLGAISRLKVEERLENYFKHKLVDNWRVVWTRIKLRKIKVTDKCVLKKCRVDMRNKVS